MSSHAGAGAHDGERPEEWPPAPLADRGSLSQHQAARRLAIDRTTMVALLDGLEAKGLVERRPHPGDRRRNVVEPTAEGRRVMDEALRATRDAERRLLAPLGDAEAKRFKEALRALIAPAPARGHPI